MIRVPVRDRLLCAAGWATAVAFVAGFWALVGWGLSEVTR